MTQEKEVFLNEDGDCTVFLDGTDLVFEDGGGFDDYGDFTESSFKFDILNLQMFVDRQLEVFTDNHLRDLSEMTKGQLLGQIMRLMRENSQLKAKEATDDLSD